jgi:hypothetical protein
LRRGLRLEEPGFGHQRFYQAVRAEKGKGDADFGMGRERPVSQVGDGDAPVAAIEDVLLQEGERARVILCAGHALIAQCEIEEAQVKGRGCLHEHGSFQYLPCPRASEYNSPTGAWVLYGIPVGWFLAVLEVIGF